ncbi:ankyrin repeat domain-containing protein [Legionella sp. km535]|uniref:ankyrin repeat domain-containing protein n=1 Tax=Legionella sp. km535 TaxID=2498107 RepID=UPI000F8CCBF5|nr:ankyrin repeat domain-containing protein [Legionella sp. km535]RUR16587.1 ankyrin repeat domain-containing protein [Legionella sp. km535]
MAIERRNFWSKLFDLPRNNESYVPYVLSLKFIWAPVTYALFSFINNVRSLFVDVVHTDDDLDHDNPSTLISNAPVLYKHTQLIRGLSSTTERDVLHYMVRSFKSNSYSKDDLGNTPLTAFLAQHVFTKQKEYLEVGHKEVMSVLSKLAELAQRSDSAKRLLLTPNQPYREITAEAATLGVPVNTPLMLLVKAGDIEGVNLLLPFYSAADLMKSTPRGNSVFHIASITGQEEMLNLLKGRATELGIWNQYQENKNNAGYTAFDLLGALITTKDFFKNLLDFSDAYLGGEEINKVAITNQGTHSVWMARKGAINFNQGLTSDNDSAEMNQDVSVTLPRY